MSVEEEITEIKVVIGRHEQRFENGRHAMDDIRKDVDKLKPKTPDWMKLFLAGVSVVGVLMGAQLWLTDRFNERPKWGQVQEYVQPLKAVQEKTVDSVRKIEASQVELGVTLKTIKEVQARQDAKLDTLLSPKRRRQ